MIADSGGGGQDIIFFTPGQEGQIFGSNEPIITLIGDHFFFSSSTKESFIINGTGGGTSLKVSGWGVGS